MTQHLPIWLLGQVPIKVCDAAVSEFSIIKPRDAAMGTNGENIEHSQRNTTVRFTTDNHWFGGIMYEHALKANRDNSWNYDINFHEAVQYAEYGLEQHYDWHTDTFTLSRNEYDRKITAVCLMNDVSEFEGGEFQIKLYQEYIAPLQKGTIIAFPSILEHRVTPVTKGVRASATIWLNGPRFK